MKETSVPIIIYMFAKLPSIHQYVIYKTYEQGKSDLPYLIKNMPKQIFLSHVLIFLPEKFSPMSTKPRECGLSKCLESHMSFVNFCSMQ